ncbi:MAG TPA: ATP:cob(I)alamin adenosyltransferase, partial [Petrotogaceae bacterium]|nr:ATP:cob(I)alamin adenosyltransferase [Petrotogaceae bacterium]
EAVPVQVGQYINRLSDLLFIVARYEEYLKDKIIYK